MASQKPAVKSKPVSGHPEKEKPAKEKPQKPAEKPKELKQVKEAPKPEPKPLEKAVKEKPKFNALLFNRWDLSEVKVSDAGLRKYINLTPIIVPRTGGKFGPVSVHKTKINIIERMMNKLQGPGHRGKRHKLTSCRCCGNVQAIYLAMKGALERVEKKTGKNPVQVLVKAIENASPLEEVAAYRLGSIMARKAVITSPQRRLDLALRYFTQGVYKKSFSNRRSFADVLADEIMAAASSDPKCFAISERMRLEKEAEGAR